MPIPTYAMFDSGASLSAINSDLVNKISSPVQKIDIRLGTFDAETVAEREVTSFSISNLQGNLSIQVNNALVGNILSTENEVPPSQSQLKDYPHLANLPFPQLEDPTVGIILDAKYAHHFLTGELTIGETDEPIAITTDFGNALIGPPLKEGENDAKICILNSEALSLTDEVRRLFRQDFLAQENQVFSPEEAHFSVNDEISLQKLENSFEFNEETAHYSSGIPWTLGCEKSCRKF